MLMEELLRHAKKHEDATIFKAIFQPDDSHNSEGSMANRNPGAQPRMKKIRGPLSQQDAIGHRAKAAPLTGNPDGITKAGIFRGDAKAGDDRVIGAGHYPEEHWIGVLDDAPGLNLLDRRIRHVAEEKIGDILLKDHNLAVG